MLAQSQSALSVGEFPLLCSEVITLGRECGIVAGRGDGTPPTGPVAARPVTAASRVFATPFTASTAVSAHDGKWFDDGYARGLSRTSERVDLGEGRGVDRPEGGVFGIDVCSL